MTTVADNNSNLEARLTNVENRQERTEALLNHVVDRLSNLEGRTEEMSKSLQDVRAGLRHVQIAIWGLAAAMLTGMGAMSAALVAVALRI